jgi:hypothetical protein
MYVRQRVGVGNSVRDLHQSDNFVAGICETLLPLAHKVVLLRQSNFLGIVYFETAIRGNGRLGLHSEVRASACGIPSSCKSAKRRTRSLIRNKNKGVNKQPIASSHAQSISCRYYFLRNEVPPNPKHCCACAFLSCQRCILYKPNQEERWF